MKLVLVLLAAVSLLLSSSLRVSQAAGTVAGGDLKGKDGKLLGTAILTENNDGSVKLVVKYANFPAGTHGLHFHAVGKCEGPDFASAGAHFNPAGHKHGLQSPDGGHAGDLTNLVVTTGGSGTFETVSTHITLSDGPNKLLGPNGAALVVHANPDDEKTDPSGNSGARLACAVLTLTPANLPASGLGSSVSPVDNFVWVIPVGLVVLMAVGLGGLVVIRRLSR